MSLILGKYKRIKRIGRGFFGQVILVQDGEGNQFAIKMISKKLIKQLSYIGEYLQEQYQCFLRFDNPYIVKLFNFEEDDYFECLIFEYCNGINLLHLQAKKHEKIFPLDEAISILVEIMKGIQIFHNTTGYVYRDIKPQNILIKISEQNERQYKLASLSFQQKDYEIEEGEFPNFHYMSPQIFSKQCYSYQVDVWAFGVLFYFMLNVDYPFKTNPHLPIQKKRDQLIKKAKNFSYAAAVEKSKKKKRENCTPQMEDLFKRIFTPEAEERITFSEMRKHAIFEKYFPKKKELIDFQEIDKSKNTLYSEQQQFLELKHSKIMFLLQTEKEIIEVAQFIEEEEILRFKYLLLRYYIILIKEFINDLRPEILEKEINLNWKGFIETKQFKRMFKQYKDYLDSTQKKLKALFNHSICKMKKIKTFNSTTEQRISLFIQEDEKYEDIKQSYHNATRFFYSNLRKIIEKDEKFLYFLVIVTICHSFQKILQEKDNDLRQFFMPCLEKTEILESSIIMDFSELRYCLKKTSIVKKKQIGKKIIDRYLS